MRKEVYCQETRAVQTDLVLPNDTNNHNSLFGGALMKKIDAIASVSARRLCRRPVVTASMDSVDFLQPVLPTDCLTLESFVSWTGNTSIEVFVKVLAEDLNTGERRIAATSFLTFVPVKNPEKVPVPQIIPETQNERYLFETGEERNKMRKRRRVLNKQLADTLSTKQYWDILKEDHII